MNKFSERLKDLRTSEKGLTQKKLALIINSTDDCIFFWEKGRSEPSIDDIIALANYFDVSIDYLLGRSDNLN